VPIYDPGTKEWRCKYCNVSYYNELSAKGCESNHEVVLIEIYREDLMRLMQFLYTKDETLLTDRLIKTLRKYSSNLKGKAF
jgi:hypothetical protein